MSQPPLIQNLSNALRQPVGIATLVSVGVHGLLWVVLPVLPLASKTPEAEQKRMVQLVELTPEEQSRVPQFTQPQALPPLNLPQGKPLPSPLTQPLQPPTIDPSLLYPLPITPPPTINWSFANRLQQRQDASKPKLQKQKPERTDSTKTKNPVERTGDQSPAERTPEQETSKPQGTDQTTPNKAAPVLPPNIPPEAIARLQQRQQELQAMQKNLGYDPAGATKTDKEYLGNVQAFGNYYQDMLKNVPPEKVSEDIQTPEKVTNLYPKDACPFKLNGVTEVGAVVKPNGEIEGEPTVLLSSAYKLFNKAAVAYVQGNKLDASEKYRVLRYRFMFNYSDKVCPASKPGASAG